MTQNTNIVADFTNKQESYFHNNYVKETKSNFLRRERRERISAFALEGRQHRTVLDVGCGPAILYPEILESCESYTAVDLVPANLEQIQKEFAHDKLDCQCENVDDLNFSDRKFDLIICSGSLEYTSNPVGNLERISGWLNPGGRLIASMACTTSPYRLWSEYIYNPFSRFVKNLFGKKVPAYRRKLCSASGLVKRVAKNEQHKLDYLGYKLIPQPLDILLNPIDFFFVKRLQKSQPSFLSWACIEFILVMDKQKQNGN